MILPADRLAAHDACSVCTARATRARANANAWDALDKDLADLDASVHSYKVYYCHRRAAFDRLAIAFAAANDALAAAKREALAQASR